MSNDNNTFNSFRIDDYLCVALNVEALFCFLNDFLKNGG